MNITAIRVSLRHLALTKPYTIAYNTFSDVEIVLLEIELANGIVGIGTASPAEDVVGENSRHTLGHLQSDFVQGFIGRDIRHFQQLIDEAGLHFPHLPGTLAAIDLALHDAFCKWLGISVAAFYGVKIQALPTSVTIGIMSLEDTLNQADAYLQQGFKVIKLKTGIDVKEDIEKVQLLTSRNKGQLKLRVDANQGYSFDDLKQFIRATSNTGIELIEQPLKVGKESELLQLSEDERRLLAADESLKDPEAALQYSGRNKPFGIFNIKLMKCGGIRAAFEIATIARLGGIDLFWGCNDESIHSITAALHAAYCCVNTKYIDLDGSFDLAEDLVTGGFKLQEGHLLINQMPGLGTIKVGGL